MSEGTDVDLILASNYWPFPFRRQSRQKYLARSHLSDEIEAGSPVAFDADERHGLHLLIIGLPRRGFFSVRRLSQMFPPAGRRNGFFQSHCIGPTQRTLAELIPISRLFRGHSLYGDEFLVWN